MKYCERCRAENSAAAGWCSSCGKPLGGNGASAAVSPVQSPERLYSILDEPSATESRYGLQTVGGAVLLFGAVFGIYALNMDPSVETAFGRVNNIGLLNDKQNYIIVAGIATLAGLLMMAVGWRQTATRPTEETSTTPSIDPFDELDIEKANTRKRYAISLGVTRENGKFVFGNSSYDTIEAAIAAAEAAPAAPFANA